MVKIRLKRNGSKYNPVYKLVAADARAPRDGKFIEVLGWYNPQNKELKIEKDLTLKWLGQGAQPTNVVRRLLKQEQVLAEFAKSK